MTVKVPIVGVIVGDDGEDPQVFPREAFRAMFQTKKYDPEAALQKALSMLPPELHEDQYYLPLALIFQNVSGLQGVLPSYWGLPGKGRVDTGGIEKFVLNKLSSGELFMVQLAFHLFNDYYKLPKDGLLGLRNLDSYHFDLAMHALKLFTRGRR